MFPARGGLRYPRLAMRVFFFKQKTAYDMRISDWSSDVCSSDLWRGALFHRRDLLCEQAPAVLSGYLARSRGDRKSVVSGKSVSVRVDLGGRRIINKKKQTKDAATHRCTQSRPDREERTDTRYATQTQTRCTRTRTRSTTR